MITEKEILKLGNKCDDETLISCFNCDSLDKVGMHALRRDNGHVRGYIFVCNDCYHTKKIEYSIYHEVLSEV